MMKFIPALWAVFTALSITSLAAAVTLAVRGR